jgi:YbbR domain-containing protein
MNTQRLREYSALFIEQLKSVYAKVRHTNKKDSIIFLICLAISTAMWLLLSLSETYTARITVPVKFTNVPNDRIIVSELISNIEMEVEAAGFSLVSYRLFSGFNPLNIDLENSTSNNEGNSLTIEDTYLKDQLTNKLSSQDRLVKIRPEKISIAYSTKQYKKVPVVINDSLTFRKQYFLAEKVLIKPDSVELFGPAIYLEKIDRISATQVILSDVHESVSKKLNLILPDIVNDVSLNTTVVDATWMIDQYTEGTVEVGVNSLGLKKHQSVRFFPDSVLLTYQVGLKQFEQITPSMFTVEADFTDSLVWKNMAKIRLKPNSSSDKVSYLRIQPAAVEFLFSNTSK